jgi:hypothetical protein
MADRDAMRLILSVNSDIVRQYTRWKQEVGWAWGGRGAEGGFSPFLARSRIFVSLQIYTCSPLKITDIRAVWVWCRLCGYP